MAVDEYVYLVLSRRAVDKMYKNLPVPGRGQIIVKVHVKAADSAFREPTLVREIIVTDPLDGMSLPDIEFSQPFVTEDEVELLKARRRAAMIDLLTDQGYVITPPPPQPEGETENER